MYLRALAPSRTRHGRRRLFILFFILIGVLVLIVPLELYQLQQGGGLYNLSRSTLIKILGLQHIPDVDETFGLIHLVTQTTKNQHILGNVTNLDPTRPVDMRVYAEGERLDWNERMRKLNMKYPLVIFSKSTCRYAQRVKILLQGYNINPEPKIIEVNFRRDSDIIKALLIRLTGRSTFPNVLLCGKSIGGSTEVLELHHAKLLRGMLEDAGVDAMSNTGLDPLE